MPERTDFKNDNRTSHESILEYYDIYVNPNFAITDKTDITKPTTLGKVRIAIPKRFSK